MLKDRRSGGRPLMMPKKKRDLPPQDIDYGVPVGVSAKKP
jgi:hypothetical protein